MQKRDYERKLAMDIGGFAFDPLGFVLYAFPWGKGELAGLAGPQPWQREELESIGESLQETASLRGGSGHGDDLPPEPEQERQAQPSPVPCATPEGPHGACEPSGRELSACELPEGERERIARAAAGAIRRAVSSGHGIGKSAFVSWVILWAMSTMRDTRGVVTANTEAQLKGKTWAELAKWHKLCLCGHWFDCTATALISRVPGHEKTWRCDMAPWSERNTEAFAGLHNKGRRVFLIFDEASAIPDAVWDVSEGALTDDDTEILWLVCGNPTRNSGRFRECFGRFRHRWRTVQIDSRDVPITNKTQLRQWIDDYGEDSDFVRVRVRGVFPRAGNRQLISGDAVEEAAARTLPLESYAHAPKILGVDVARFGDDASALIRRQGLCASGLKRFRGLDLMTYAGLVAREIDDWRPDAVFVDQGGMGAGVVDRLRQLGYPHIFGVDFGGAALDPAMYRNKRTEMWCLVRNWLQRGASIPDDQDLRADLVAPEYGFTGDRGQIALEKKQDMKKRGLASPDNADALALTFAQPVRAKSGARMPRKAVSTFADDFFTP